MKLILYMAMTANGYVAKPDGETPWSKEEWNSYARIVKRFGNLIIGRRTYELMKSDERLLKKIGNPFIVVLTRRHRKDERSVSYAKTPKAAVALLKKKGFKTALIGGGGVANAAFMKAGLIYEIILDVEPLVFGRGVKLFADDNFEAKLRLLGVKKLGQNLIQLHYRVSKP
ncbi:MAG: dihydrofolate reductase [Candidatus Aenigmatarchaeota archaeon]|nr:MAG: dihydrofolate reductase [Candidatus Aenigmarchaeota archaeon]